MKNSLLFIFLPALCANSFAQTPKCVKIKGDRKSGKFQQVLIGTAKPGSADKSQTEIVAAAWTCVVQEQELCDFRSLLRFDVSAVPANTFISGAKLYLYAKTNNINGNPGNPTYGTNNTALLQKITANWQGTTVSWDAPPAVAIATQKILPQSDNATQNYVIDVTDFVQSWINKPDSNFGMLLRLQIEKHYNSLVFHSGQAPAALQPRLEICFPATAPVATSRAPVPPKAIPVTKAPIAKTPPIKESKTLIIRGDRTSGLFKQLFLDSNAPFASDNSQPELGAAAWTCNSGGYPTCNFRSVFRYEVSGVPANAKIISARLYLFAKTNNINGQLGNPTFGTNNKALLQRVTTPWKLTGTGWKNQPRTTTEKQKVLAQSTSNQQNYVLDVTDFVLSWVQHPDQNFGMLIRLQTEAYYNSLVFNSGQGPIALQPRLEIRYEMEKK